MVLRKGFYLSCFAAGTATLVLAFNNCARDAGVVAGSTQLASSGCKIDPSSDVLLSSIKNGDDHVSVYGSPEQAASLANEKVYFDNTGNPATAPRWKLTDNIVPWYYNPSGAPASIASKSVEVIKASMDYWSSVCNIKFSYMGTTTAGSGQTNGDNTNVFGWGDALGATGITFSYMKGSKAPISISEADIQFNGAQIGDTTTLRAVANHELGHLIGMRHSDVAESIMFANPYHDVPYLLMLRKDDVDACVGLYGLPGATATPTPSPTPTATPAPTATPKPSPTATPVPGSTPKATPVPISNQGC